MTPSFVDTACDRALAPLDAARAAVYRALAPRFGAWLASRERRVALLGVFTVATAALATLVAPLVLLVWAPLVIGVPHLVADLRYLVARPGLHRRGAVVAGVGIPVALAGAVGDVRVGIAATLGAVIVARAGIGVRIAAGVVVLGVLALATWAPDLATLLLVHLHNAIAGLAWWVWRRDRPRSHAIVVLVAVAVWGAFAGGVFSGPVIPERGGVTEMAAAIAPFSSVWGPRLLLAFVYAQAVHYGAWLRLVPEDDRARRTPRPFRASARALVADLGAPLVGIAVLAWIGLFAWGLGDPAAARAGYLTGAVFHGHLEIAALTLAFLEGRRPGERRE